MEEGAQTAGGIASEGVAQEGLRTAWMARIHSLRERARLSFLKTLNTLPERTDYLRTQRMEEGAQPAGGIASERVAQEGLRTAWMARIHSLR